MTPHVKQVLLVDDEEKLRQSIARRLKMLGFHTFTAASGMGAIDIAISHPIHLAIVDLKIPDMNGLVTITKLKEIQPELITILLTGHGNAKVRQATESLNSLYFEKEEMPRFWQFIKHVDSGNRSERALNTLPSLAEVERRHIARVLAAANGNKTQTAKILGISRAALWRKLKRMAASPAAPAQNRPPD